VKMVKFCAYHHWPMTHPGPGISQPKRPPVPPKSSRSAREWMQ
jgi:hypothetical protein